MVDLRRPSAATPPPADAAELLHALTADEPARPRVTWYGPDGERVELSGRTLANWVAKIANLLVLDLDAGPGSRVAVDLPPHWRTATWLLGVWAAGACAVVTTPGTAGPASSGGPVPVDVDVVVSTDPERLAAAVAAGRDAVAVALPVAAVGYGPGLPAGAVDAVVEVRLQGDDFAPLVEAGPADPALEVHGPEVLTIGHGALVEHALGGTAGWPARPRLLTGAGAGGAATTLLAPLARGGSVVVHHDLAGLPAPDVERLADVERVTVIVP